MGSQQGLSSQKQLSVLSVMRTTGSEVRGRAPIRLPGVVRQAQIVGLVAGWIVRRKRAHLPWSAPPPAHRADPTGALAISRVVMSLEFAKGPQCSCPTVILSASLVPLDACLGIWSIRPSEKRVRHDEERKKNEEIGDRRQPKDNNFRSL